MKVAPFVGEGINQQNTPMGDDLHLLPHVHVLYFGPLECARHTYAGLSQDPDGSILVIDDLQTSLGETEDLVEQAVGELSAADASIEGFMFCTACQTAFLGIDLDALCKRLHDRTGLYFCHVEMNRMWAGNIPGTSRKEIPGGDRLHVRRATCSLLEQVDGRACATCGILVLTGDRLDGRCDLRDYELLDGIDWVRGMGDMSSIGLFAQARDAALVVATAMSWNEAGEYLSKRFGIPYLYLPTSYSEEEIAGYYHQLDEQLADFGTPAQWEQLRARRAERRRTARRAIDWQLVSAPMLELDLRVVERPFSLVETLIDYGFDVKNFLPSRDRVSHKEADDLPAFERLSERYPIIGKKFAKRDKPSGKDRGRMLSRQDRGRFVSLPPVTEFHRVPEETAWWGYSSICMLMDYIENGEHDALPDVPADGGGEVVA